MASAVGRLDELPRLYDLLLDRYGPQRWWPADSPFEVMVGAVLTQNTAWSNVEQAIARLQRHRLLDAARLLACDPGRLAGLIRPSGYYNVKAQRLQNLCRQVESLGGVAAMRTLSTGQLRARLLEVNGIGPETADAILLYAFERPVFVVDAYLRRILARCGLIRGDEPYERLRQAVEAQLPGDVARLNELHALVVRHAKAHCRSRPRCTGCAAAPGCDGATNN